MPSPCSGLKDTSLMNEYRSLTSSEIHMPHFVNCQVRGLSPGEGTGNPLQYSCLENSMDRGAWQAIVHGVAKSQT